jgi:hypothetical protein
MYYCHKILDEGRLFKINEDKLYICYVIEKFYLEKGIF